VRAVVPILNVADVRASLAWFEQLGWETTFEWDEDGGGEPGFASAAGAAGDRAPPTRHSGRVAAVASPASHHLELRRIARDRAVPALPAPRSPVLT
jgi:hypothetical protein